jgi:hypothetical protein
MFKSETDEAVIERRRTLRLLEPRSPDQLYAYITHILGFRMPRRPISPGSSAPFEYLCQAYFEDRQPRDLVVWANRGGGKTQLGAIATLLDMLFKPGIQIRILGGSFDQSSKMHQYLRRLLMNEVFADFVEGQFTGTHVQLVNGSRVEVLSQSQRAVRGQRVHKLRCDELELFEPDVWEAAQLVTRSGDCCGRYVHGSIEALSTMHLRHGLMQSLVENPQQPRRILRWNVLDVLERCPPQRSCESCALWIDCRGRAKNPAVNGFLRIDDAIAQIGRVGNATWQAEMLCAQPDSSDAVFPEFDSAVHVIDEETEMKLRNDYRIIAGIDFGYRAPTVLLWAALDERDCLTVIEEMVLREHTSEEFIAVAKQRMSERALPWPVWIGADPAGHSRNEQTGVSTIALWKRAGFAMRTRNLGIETGVMAVRRRLKRGDGAITLRIASRCPHLIEAVRHLHYPPPGRGARRTSDPPTTPVKDGHDHACDALRYMITNLDDSGHTTRQRTYLGG